MRHKRQLAAPRPGRYTSKLFLLASKRKPLKGTKEAVYLGNSLKHLEALAERTAKDKSEEAAMLATLYAQCQKAMA